MTPKVKKILALLLVLGVAAVWVPQLLSANTKIATRTLLERSADGPEARVPMAHDAAGHVQESAGASKGSGDDDLGAALASSIAKAKLLAPEKAGLDLEQLASAWSVPNETPPSVASTSPVPLPVEIQNLAPPEHFDPVPPVDPVAAFLAAHPLQGTLIGAGDRLANLGPLLVHVGDEPLQGLVVTAIEARCVSFEYKGAALRSDLVPFQARASTRQAAGGSGAGAGASNPPGAAGASATTGTTGATLEALLPLLQSAVGAQAQSSAANPATVEPGATGAKSGATNQGGATGTQGSATGAQTGTTKEPRGS